MSQTGTQAATDLRKNAGKGKRPGAQQLVDIFGLDPKTMTQAERRGAISGYDLRHRIEMMVAGITARKIKHIYKGDGAATAPGLMILPRIPATHLFPMRHVRVLLGYTAHEISHQLETDFGLLGELIEDETQPMRWRRHVKEFWNAIEDYRIEKVVRREYPGFHVFIDETRDFSADRFCERVAAGLLDPKALANPYRIGAVALTWIGAELNAYRTRRPKDALALIDPDLADWLNSWRNDMVKVETCRQARDLAERIVDELDRLRSEEKQDEADGSGSKSDTSGKKSQSGNGNPNKGDEGDDASCDGDSGANPSEKDGAQEDDPTPQEAGGDTAAGDADETDVDETGKADGKGKRTEGDAADDDPATRPEGDDDTSDGAGSDPASQGDANKEGDDADREADGAGEDSDNHKTSDTSQVERPPLKVNEGDEQQDAEAADLEIEDLTRAISSLKGSEAKDANINDSTDICRGDSCGDEQAVAEKIRYGQAAYSQIRREIGGAAARSAGILRRMLQSQHRRTWQGGKEDGDLDFGRLVPMAQGAPDIYRQKADRIGINSAVHLLLDNSGSMSGHPITICQQSAVVLDMAIQGTRTNIEITGFTGNADRPVLYRYRSFGDKGQAASASLGSMHDVSMMGTPVSTPLLEAWRRLQQQKEPRRILIVVSDGGAEWNDVQPAQEAHDFIASQGCHVIGIAIGCADLMRQWCANTVGIESIDDLPIALTTLVQEALK